MAIFKCKTCGGSVTVIDGASIGECEYCGTQQTLPKTTDENIQNLFNRANLLRQKNEFDKAESLYEKILEADEKEAEAYWGVILCKFGIEYVEDPKTYKRIPTCHRTSYDSIVADEYYKRALEYADMTQRSMYEMEAKQIDEIQKGILAVATNEDPYDVFICYKETDESGKRTQDSVIANDIYYQLKQEGFKVFYAAITLEGKLGSAYEPIIFAALNSAKVMLVVGSKPEYFNAVWVKNEWSRFLKIIKKDRSKLLIPCYKDMDAYELPEEFAHLQAQDMSKIGFINDVVRGIKKVIKKDDSKATATKVNAASTTNSNVAPLLKRAFMFLEDKKWEDADNYAEKVLDLNPENAEAYLVKLMVELEVSTKEELKDEEKPFDNYDNYKKIIRFADDGLKSTLAGYIEYINDRNEKNRLETTYSNALRTMKTAQKPEQFNEAALRFKSIKGYLDSSELEKECYEKAKECRLKSIYNRAKALTASQQTQEKYREAALLFKSIKGYLDSSELEKECYAKAEECRKNTIYSQAMREVNKYTSHSYTQAISMFDSIIGWRDADEQAAKCRAELPELIKKEEIYRAQQEQLRKEREERERVARAKKAKEDEKNQKKTRAVAFFKIMWILGIAIFVFGLFAFIALDESEYFFDYVLLEGYYDSVQIMFVLDYFIIGVGSIGSTICKIIFRD